jgi:hypothetical protein
MLITLSCWVSVSLIFETSALAGVSEWVDIKVEDGLLLVDSEVAGIPGYAAIDTGASLNGINENFLTANDLTFPKGRPVEIVGVYGTSRRSNYRDVPVKLFGVDLDFEGLIELNIGPPGTQLLLGSKFLQQFIFQFDYPNQRMRIITRDSVDLKKVKNVQSKRDPKGGSPIVKVRLNDEKDVWLLMDTGSNGGVLIDRTFAKKQNWLDRYPATDSIAAGVNSQGRMQNFNLPTMTFGPYEIENTIVSVPAEGEDIELFETDLRQFSRIKERRSSSQGLLGYDVLKHFVVTIDYKAGHVHIDAGGSPQEDDQ